jgi:hypothetical protein
MRQRILWAAFLVVVVSLGSSCAAPRINKAVPAFAEAVTLTADNTKGAFDALEDEYGKVETARLIVNYDKQGFDPGKVRTLFTSDDLRIRLELLDSLQQYATSLEQVSADEKLQELDQHTRAAGMALQKLSQSSIFSQFATRSETPVNIAAAAVNAIGHWFVEGRRQRDLPAIVNDMQEPVARVAELLRADIGQLPNSDGKGGSGLRAQMWNQYSEAMLQQDALIRMSSGNERNREIAKLRTLALSQRRADATLRQTANALEDLVTAHQELLDAVQTRTDVRSSITALLLEGRRIRDYYQSLKEQEE